MEQGRSVERPRLAWVLSVVHLHLAVLHHLNMNKTQYYRIPEQLVVASRFGSTNPVLSSKRIIYIQDTVNTIWTKENETEYA